MVTGSVYIVMSFFSEASLSQGNQIEGICYRKSRIISPHFAVLLIKWIDGLLHSQFVRDFVDLCGHHFLVMGTEFTTYQCQ